jgi:hypothetical protein
MKVNQKVRQKVKGWNVNFHKWKEGDLNLQEILKPVPIPKKSTKKKDNCGILCLCSSIVCNKSKKEKLKTKN